MKPPAPVTRTVACSPTGVPFEQVRKNEGLGCYWVRSSTAITRENLLANNEYCMRQRLPGSRFTCVFHDASRPASESLSLVVFIHEAAGAGWHAVRGSRHR